MLAKKVKRSFKYLLATLCIAFVFCVALGVGIFNVYKPSNNDNSQPTTYNNLTLNSGFSDNQYVVVAGKVYKYSTETTGVVPTDTSSKLSFNSSNTLELIFLKDSVSELSSFSFDDKNIASVLQATKVNEDSIIEIDLLYLTQTANITTSLDADYTLGTLALNTNSELSYVDGEFTIGSTKGSTSLLGTKAEAQVLDFASGTLTLSNSTYTAKSAGRAINQTGGTLTLSSITLTKFSSTEDGGAIYKTGGSLTLSSCSVTNNTAVNGGAIYNSGTLTLTSCTLTGNTAANGPAVYNNSGTLNLNGGDISSNTATTTSGDIYLASSVYITLNASLTKAVTVYKAGLTSYDDNTGNSSVIAYSTNATYLNSAKTYVTVTNYQTYHQYSTSLKTNYLVCEYKSYTATFNGNGGSNGTSITKKYKAALGTLPTSTRTGYAFNGWFTAASGGTQISTTTTMPAGNVTYYAHWTANTITITLDNQSATSAGSTAAYYKYNTNTYYSNSGCTTTITSITKPTRTGYTFGGYYTSTNGGGTQYITAAGAFTNNLYSAVSSNTTLYAKWTANVYKVTLDNQSATTAGTTEYYYQFNTTKTINGVLCYYFTTSALTTGLKDGYYITCPTKTGYTFDGYYTSTGGSGTQYVDASGSCVNNLYAATSVAKDITLYAKWTVIQYTLNVYAYNNTASATGTFANSTTGGTVKIGSGTAGKSATSKINYGATATITATPATGYSFSGWYTSTTFTGTAASTSATFTTPAMGTSGLNYYAKFTINSYTITISRNNTSYGTVSSSSVTAYYGAAVSTDGATVTIGGTKVTATPTAASGYTTTFSSWGNASGSVTGARTITANFTRTANTITITLDNQSATSAGSTAVYYKYNTNTYYSNSGCTTQITSITCPTRTGYTFGGYYTSTGGGGTQYITEAGAFTNNLYSAVSSNTTLYAKWTVIQYTLNVYAYNNTASATGTFANSTTGGTVKIGSGTAGKSATSKINYGATASITATAATGYSFSGWYTSTTFTGTAASTSATFTTPAMGTSGLNYYAKFTINSYTITISRNNTSYGTVSSSSVTAYYGAAVSTDGATVTIGGTKVTATPTAASGYTTTFSSWSNASESVTGARTITANFTRTANTITITLNNQSATSAGSTAVYYKYNTNTYYSNSGCTTQITSITCPTRTGYTFGGYYTSTGGSGTQYITAAGAFTNNLYSAVSSNTTLYAKWTVIQYTLNVYAYNNTASATGTFANSTTGGTVKIGSGTAGASATSKINYGATATITATAATGYSFSGWYTSTTFTGTAASTSATFTTPAMGTSGLNYYAKFTINTYTLNVYAYNNTASATGTFANATTGGTVKIGSGTAGKSASSSVYYGQTASITATAATGYSFAGWYTSTTFTGTAASTSATFTTPTMGTSGLNYYAKFTINSYTITISRNNTSYGTVSSSSVTAYYGQTISTSGATVTIGGTKVTATPTAASGYTTTFSSWDNASGSVTGARTITANFTRTANTYTLTFDGNSPDGSTVTQTVTSEQVTYGSNSLVSMVTAIASCTGYIFNGYYTAATGGDLVFDWEGDVIGGVAGFTDNNSRWIGTSDKTVYAQWTDNFGLYNDAGVQIYSWIRLIDNKYVTVSGTTVTDFNTSLAGKLVIPNTITSIGDDAFNGCSGLTSITIPNSVTSIGRWAFEGCTGLKSLTIPNSVTSIGYCAFAHCTSLTSITIPNSVTSISSNAFYNCSNLTSITVDSANTKYHSKDNCIIETRTNTLILGCKTSVIPNYVTSIGDDAFSGCSGLRNIDIPNSVTSIGRWAFEYSGLTSIIIPNSVTSIGDSAFYCCTGLSSITIPDSVTELGYYAFSSCSDLLTVILGSGLTSIYPGTFEYCNQLERVVLGTNITDIGDGAFAGCCSLVDLTIPRSVTYIGADTFNDCIGILGYDFTALTSVPEFDMGGNFAGINSECKIYVSQDTYNDWVTVLENFGIDINNIVPSDVFGLYDNNGRLTSTWAELLTDTSNYEVEQGVLLYCNIWDDSLLKISATVVEIGDYAICGGDFYSRIIFPSSIRTVGEGAFVNSFAASLDFTNLTEIPYSADNAFDLWGDNNCYIYVPLEDFDSWVNGFGNLAELYDDGDNTNNIIGIPRAGLYYDPDFIEMMYTWEELIDMGLIDVQNGVITQCLLSEYGEEFGALVLPNSVHIISIGSMMELPVYALHMGTAVSVIEPYALQDSIIEKVYISDSVYYIGEGAFVNCSYLSQVHMGRFNFLDDEVGIEDGYIQYINAPYIGAYAFYNCAYDTGDFMLDLTKIKKAPNLGAAALDVSAAIKIYTTSDGYNILVAEPVWREFMNYMYPASDMPDYFSLLSVDYGSSGNQGVASIVNFELLNKTQVALVTTKDDEDRELEVILDDKHNNTLDDPPTQNLTTSV